MTTAATFPALFAAAWAAQGGELPACDPDLGVGPCELCGYHGIRVAWRPKSNWTAYDTHAYPGEGAVCLGCALLLDGGPEVNERGRARRWTLYTLATDGDSQCGWALKDDKPRIARWIEDGWSVSVADGGKKHVAYSLLDRLSVRGVVLGLRAEESGYRRRIARSLIDPQTRTYRSAAKWGGIPALCPIVDWTEGDIWAYITTHDLPYHEVYDREGREARSPHEPWRTWD